MSLDLSSARTNPVRLVWLCVAGKWDSVKSAGFVLRNETIPGLSQAFPRGYLWDPLAAGQQWLLPNFAPMPPKMLWPPAQSTRQVLLLGAGQSHRVLRSLPFPSLLWKHGTVEWFGLEGALNLIPFQTPARGVSPTRPGCSKPPAQSCRPGVGRWPCHQQCHQPGDPRTCPHFPKPTCFPPGQSDPSLLPFPSLSPAWWRAG